MPMYSYTWTFFYKDKNVSLRTKKLKTKTILDIGLTCKKKRGSETLPKQTNVMDVWLQSLSITFKTYIILVYIVAYMGTVLFLFVLTGQSNIAVIFIFLIKHFPFVSFVCLLVLVMGILRF